MTFFKKKCLNKSNGVVLRLKQKQKRKNEKMKKLVLTLALAVAGITLNAQTVEELKAEKAKKTAEAAKLTGEATALQAKIDAFPGWKYGASGTVGATFSGFNNWFSNALPNSSSGNVGVIVNGYANLDREKFFWRNSGVLNLGWVKLNDETISTDSSDFEATTDVFQITSLYGYKLSDKWAASALGEYRTTFLENFNDPGYLDLGVGFTWTPMSELVVVIHPLNYNFVFSDGSSDYESSLGAKVVADYNKQFGKFKFRSNLSAFVSYEDVDNLSNWTWTNSLGFNVWKGIGVSLESGLRGNKQEAYNIGNGGIGTLEDTDNELQSYWLLGLSYGF